MGDQHLHAVLQHVRKLAAAPAANPPSDRDLLDRFVARRDEAAFAALVERHGASGIGYSKSVQQVLRGDGCGNAVRRQWRYWLIPTRTAHFLAGVCAGST